MTSVWTQPLLLKPRPPSASFALTLIDLWIISRFSCCCLYLLSVHFCSCLIFLSVPVSWLIYPFTSWIIWVVSSLLPLYTVLLLTFWYIFLQVHAQGFLRDIHTQEWQCWTYKCSTLQKTANWFPNRLYQFIICGPLVPCSLSFGVVRIPTFYSHSGYRMVSPCVLSLHWADNQWDWTTCHVYSIVWLDLLRL